EHKTKEPKKMRSPALHLSRHTFIRLCAITLVLPSLSIATSATTRLRPAAAAPARAQANAARRSGAPVGSRLTPGTHGEYRAGGPVEGAALSQFGSVVGIHPTGEVYSIHEFAGADGAPPAGTVTLGRDGFLYGVTISGGASQAGTIYRVLPDGSSFSTVYAF